MGSLISVGTTGRTHLVFDNILSEEYTHTAQVSNHPIGSRSTPADHRLDEPDVLDIVGRITESPLATVAGAPPLFFNDLNGTLDISTTDLLTGLSDLEGNRPRALTAELFIKAFKTGLWEYSSASMGLKRNLVMVSFDYKIGTARHVDFNIKLQAIEFIEAQRVELPVLAVLKKAPEACPQTGTGDKAKTNLGSANGDKSTINPRDISLAKNGALFGTGANTDAELLTAFKTRFSFGSP
jgi:hypothetical protein